jgi:hypothetical protein
LTSAVRASRCAPTALVLLIAAASRAAAQEFVYVDGRKTNNVTYDGPPWERAREWIEGAGAGTGIFARDVLGAGNFQIEVRAAIVGAGASGCALRLGENTLVLDGEDGGLDGDGPLFGNKRTHLGDARAFIAEGRRFDCNLRRTGTSLALTIDGRSVAQITVDERAVGRVGVVPGKATVRVWRFAMQGELAPPAADPEDESLRGPVDAAVGRGVDWLVSKQMRDGSWRHMQYGFVPGQTALSVYTLLRAGLPADHPAIVRALAYLDPLVPSETYSAGVMAMAFEASADPARVPRIKACVARILDWDQRGQWGYPMAHENDFAHWLTYGSNPDLSNTQYAALGLRAAHHAGLDVPDKVWIEMLERTLALQEDARAVDTPVAGDKTAQGRIAVAGFRYAKERDVSASMTAAGVGVVRMCRDALGPRLRGKLAADSARAIQLGVAWIDHEFNLDNHVGGSNVWQYYAIYGIERVGTLLGIDSFGHHDWYPEGARWLLSKQDKEGSWSVPGTFNVTPWHSDQAEGDTCFAILFLKRASRPTVQTGGRGSRERAEPPADGSPVWLRASGTTTVTFWIGGFAPDVVARLATGTPPGLHVESVEYASGNEVIGAVNGDASAPWSDAGYTIRHTFDHAGKHAVVARVRVIGPAGPEVVTSKAVDVRSEGVVQPWMLAAATARQRDLLADAHATVTASSEHAPGEVGSKACDGAQWTRWVCGETDPAPSILVEVQKPVPADRLVLSPACVSPDELGRFDRIEQVSVRLNREKEPVILDLEADELQPTVLEFGKTVSVSRLEIRVTKRKTGGAAKNQAGFAEIALERREH